MHVTARTPPRGVSLGERVYLVATTGRGNGRRDRCELEMPEDARDYCLLGEDGNDP